MDGFLEEVEEEKKEDGSEGDLASCQLQTMHESVVEHTTNDADSNAPQGRTYLACRRGAEEERVWCAGVEVIDLLTLGKSGSV